MRSWTFQQEVKGSADASRTNAVMQSAARAPSIPKQRPRSPTRPPVGAQARERRPLPREPRAPPGRDPRRDYQRRPRGIARGGQRADAGLAPRRSRRLLTAKKRGVELAAETCCGRADFRLSEARVSGATARPSRARCPRGRRDRRARPGSSGCREDAGEVQGVRCRQLQPLALVGARAAGGAERVHPPPGSRPLPATMTRTRPRGSLRGPRAIGGTRTRIPPGRRARLAGEQIAQHAPANKLTGRAARGLSRRRGRGVVLEVDADVRSRAHRPPPPPGRAARPRAGGATTSAQPGEPVAAY